MITVIVPICHFRGSPGQVCQACMRLSRKFSSENSLLRVFWSKHVTQIFVEIDHRFCCRFWAAELPNYWISCGISPPSESWVVMCASKGQKERNAHQLGFCTRMKLIKSSRLGCLRVKVKVLFFCEGLIRKFRLCYLILRALWSKQDFSVGVGYAFFYRDVVNHIGFAVESLRRILMEIWKRLCTSYRMIFSEWGVRVCGSR